MSKRHPSLFQVGQLAESRSFIPGFRSAWFRCEIKEVAWSRGQIKYYARYYDYDADEKEWLFLYKTLKNSRGSNKAKTELILRPQFPPIYHESELPDMNASSEVVVVVDGGWSVGDMVDWREKGCYWIGTVTKILGDDTVEIKLPDKPVGEGLSYVASCKDLRPSLNWSPESGWTLPVPMESQNVHSHARLLQPAKQASLSKSLVDVVEKGKSNTKATPRSLLDASDSISSHTSASSLPLLSRLMRSKCSTEMDKDIPGKDREQAHEGSMELDSVSSMYVGCASTEVPVARAAKKQEPESASAKKVRLNESIRLNSTSCDSVESAIMDLEELVCRVKWLKQILKSGSSSASLKGNWEYLECPTVSEPK